MKFSWVISTTLIIEGVQLPPCATLPWYCAGLALRFYNFLFLNSPLLLGAGSQSYDGAGRFLLCVKDVWFALLFCCPTSFCVVLTFLFWNSSLSLILSYSTYWTCLINLSMLMSPINIPTLPYFLDRWNNPNMYKLIPHLISATIFKASRDSWVNFRL